MLDICVNWGGGRRKEFKNGKFDDKFRNGSYFEY